MKKLIKRIGDFFRWMKLGVDYSYDQSEISWHVYDVLKEKELEGMAQSIATYYNIMSEHPELMNEYWRRMGKPEMIKD